MMILWSHKQIETFARTHRSVQLKLICHRNIPFVMWHRKNVGKAFSLFQLYFQPHLVEHILFAASRAPPPSASGRLWGKKGKPFPIKSICVSDAHQRAYKTRTFPQTVTRPSASAKRWFAPKVSHSGWLWNGLCPKRFRNCTQRTTISSGQCNLTWFYDLSITSDTVCDKSLLLIDWERSNWKSLTKLPPNCAHPSFILLCIVPTFRPAIPESAS